MSNIENISSLVITHREAVAYSLPAFGIITPEIETFASYLTPPQRAALGDIAQKHGYFIAQEVSEADKATLANWAREISKQHHTAPGTAIKKVLGIPYANRVRD